MTDVNNPPVFPITHNGSTLPGRGGLTMRDYFAAKALVALLPLCGTNTSAAEEAYWIADAMLKAREKQ